MDLATATESPTTAKKIVQWALATGRFTYYHLAKKIGGKRERPKRDRSRYEDAARKHNSIIVNEESPIIERLRLQGRWDDYTHTLSLG